MFHTSLCGESLYVLSVSKSVATPTTNVLVFDLADPTAPRLAGTTDIPGSLYPYYPFYCGVGWGYWFNFGQSSWTDTTNALVFLDQGWDATGKTPTTRLTSLDLTDATKPTVTLTDVTTRANGYFMGLVPDAGDPSGRFLTFADYLTPTSSNGTTITKTRNYAQRFHQSGAGWVGEGAVNLPGQLVRSWIHASGQRAYLTSDNVNYTVADGQGGTSYRSDTRLNLLRAATAADGHAVAELRSTTRFSDRYVSDLVVDGNALFVNARPGYYYGYGVATSGPATSVGVGGGVATKTSALTIAEQIDQQSDRQIAFDLSQFSFKNVYDQPTGTQGVQFMGTHEGQLFVNVAGDGILAVDVSDPSHPTGRQFLRTLGWATHIVFAGDSAYVAAGYFGVYRMGLASPLALGPTN